MQRYYFFSKIRVFPSYLFFFKQNTILLLEGVYIRNGKKLIIK
jgi:hypothetical protein